LATRRSRRFQTGEPVQAGAWPDAVALAWSMAAIALSIGCGVVAVWVDVSHFNRIEA
jgi:hypothetical protein